MDDTFELTADLVKLLRASWVNEELSGDEYGAAEIDPKRPYGNSDVELDIAEELGWLPGEDGPTDEERARARELHALTPTALQVVLSTGSFEPGTYRRITRYGNRWERVNAPTYVTFIERNDHEGETWRFYIPIANNLDALEVLGSALAIRDAALAKEFGYEEDEPQYELDCTPLPAATVRTLVEHSDGGYMADHQLLVGRLVLPPEFRATMSDPNEDPLYKGGIRDFMRADA